MRRLLVTGFFDWREVGSPPDLSRLDHNPSGRLLRADPARARSGGGERGGALRGLLDEAWQRAQGVEATFEILPVVWDVATNISYDEYDVVVHLGLGVYDHEEVLWLERGAMHRREGLDARGLEPATTTFVSDHDVDERIQGPRWLDEGIASLEGARCGGYQVVVRQARRDNIFLCNETHGRSLFRVRKEADSAGILAAYFIHLPYPRDDDEGGLALGVERLICLLLDQIRAQHSA